jgi:hypothetical protein
MFQGHGKLIYDPRARIRFEPWWCILKTDEELVRYYQYWIKQHYDVKFEKTVWGSHISVNRAVKPPNPAFWKKYKNEIIPFTYTNRVYRVHWFLCVDAYSTRLEDIREELGLPRLPPYGFHLTIGRLNKVYHTKQV